MPSLFLLCIALLALGGPPIALADAPTLPLQNRPLDLEGVVKLSAQDRQWLSRKGELRLAIGEDLPSFDLTASGQGYEGLTADVAGLLGRSLGLPVRVLRYPDREQALRAVLLGEADLLSSANDYEVQDPRLVLTAPYVPDRPTLVRRLDDPRDLPADLAGLEIALSSSYLPLQQVQALYPKARLNVHPNPASALRSVAMGHSDLYLGDLVVANYLINQLYANHLQVAGLARLQSGGVGFALRRDEQRLRRVLDEVLTHIPPSQQALLIKRWSGGAPPALFQPELQLTVAERDWLREHPALRVATYGNYTPVTFFDGEGSYHGITADVLDQVHARTGLRIEIVRTDSMAEMLESLESGATDLIGALTPRPNQSTPFAFSRPYMNVSFVTVTPRAPEAPATLAELAGRRVAVTRNHILLEYLRRTYPEVRLVEAESLLDAMEMTARGNAEAAVVFNNAAEYYVQRVFAQKLRISELIDVAEAPISFAVRQDDPLLLSILNKVLAAIPPDELAVLVNQRWRTNVEVTEQPWRDYRQIIYQVVVVSALLLLVSLLWNNHLRHQNKLRLLAKQALREQVQFMESLINGTPHPIYVRDLQGRLLLCNDDYLHTFGLDRQTLLGAPLPEQLLGDPAEAEQLRRDYRQVIEHGWALESDRQIHIRGERLTLYHWLLPYRDLQGGVKGVIGGWIDISERRRLMEALQEAKECADEASRAKSTFLATMSHEIRTPMNAIIGMLELTLKRADQGSFDRSAIEVAHDSARNLLELIGDILDIARIESGRLSLSPVRANLRELVESVARVFEGVARQKGLDLRLEFDEHILGDVLIDPLRFKQVLSNLASNAIKFTESGSVSIRATGREGRDNRLDLHLEVEDSGIGIAEEDLDRLFQPFAQAGNNDTNLIRGAGLGLVICRTLCEMMGGTLEMHSQLGQGTQVVLRLNLMRLEPVALEAAPSPPPSDVPQRPLDVLIVDDHAANRELLIQQLGHLGHRVTTAENGALGLHAWQHGHFDLVISDCHMPVMNGYALAQRIRELELAEGRRRSRILGYTANAQREELDRCLQAGMDACLFKPASLKALEEHLAELAVLPPKEEGTPVCDLNALALLTGGKPEMNARVIDELLRANHQDMAELRENLAKADTLGIGEVAHKIKGAAKIIKAERLIESCRRLEELCSHDASQAKLQEGVEHLAEAVGTLDAALRNGAGDLP